jgi:hypothetical protein
MTADIRTPYASRAAPGMPVSFALADITVMIVIYIDVAF